MKDPVLYTNACIWRDDSYDPGIRAVYCRDGLIESFFSENDVFPAQCQVIDLKGACLYPGFIDTHTHSFEGGLYSDGLDLSAFQSIPDILEAIRIKRRSIHAQGGNVLIAWGLDENLIREKRFPSLKELDEVCDDIPLLLRRIDGHSCVINSRLKIMMMHSGIKLLKQAVYRGNDNDVIGHWFHAQCNEETVIQAYSRAAEQAMKGGFTTVHSMIGDALNSITHYALIRDRLSQFPVEFILYPQSLNMDAAIEVGATRIGGCILADGSIGSKTAALSEPYLGTPENKGKLYHTNEFWSGFISRAHHTGLQAAIHCIGDRAISQINDIYLRLHQTDPKELRHQLIHCELTPDPLVERIAASSAVCVMQPAFDLHWGGEDGLYSRSLGEVRSRQMNRFKTLRSSGITVTGGSDWYVTELDVRFGLQGAICHHNPVERLNAGGAIDLYTRSAARLSHDESRLGRIALGYQADFTIMSSSIKDNDEKRSVGESACDFDSLQVLAVVKKGRIVYDRYARYR